MATGNPETNGFKTRGVSHVNEDAIEDMVFFDRLPVRLRRIVRNMPMRLSAAQMLMMLQVHHAMGRGEEHEKHVAKTLIELKRKAFRDMRAAMKKAGAQPRL